MATCAGSPNDYTVKAYFERQDGKEGVMEIPFVPLGEAYRRATRLHLAGYRVEIIRYGVAQPFSLETTPAAAPTSDCHSIPPRRHIR